MLHLNSPAKINLFLHITGQRDDGYHNLQTLFQLLDYGDQLRFTLNTSGHIRLTTNSPNISSEQNLVYQAAKMLQARANCKLGVDIHLQKQLPIGGGLGGGSSNAATTLIGLNYLWELSFSRESLLKIGLLMGADVPIFIFGQTSWAEGIGEQLTAIERPNNWYLILNPNIHISTANVFAHQGLTRNTHPIKIRDFLEQGGRNDCQTVVESLYPEVKKARHWLAQLANARLTGTGACLFAEFTSRADAVSALEQIPAPWQGFVAKGINYSPLLEYCHLK